MEPTDPFIASRSTTLTLRDGSEILLRPIVPGDKEALTAAFERLSEASRYRRFFGGIKRLSPSLLKTLTEIDYVDHFAWVAIDTADDGTEGKGVARYVRDPEDRLAAEAAVTVVDDWHGRGLGTLLLEALGAAALENGIKTFRSYVLGSNTEMLDILEHAGAKIRSDSPGVVCAEVDLPEQLAKIRDCPLYETLKAAASGAFTPLPPLQRESA